MMNLRKFKQYWTTHTILSVFLIMISIIVIYFLNNFILALPRNAIPFLATVFSTLLGLTFTTFAIFIAFMPNLRTDYVETETFLNEGRTFRFTIYFEILALLFTFFDYLIYDTTAFVVTIYVTVVLVIWSLGFFSMLVESTFRLFTSARDRIAKGH